MTSDPLMQKRLSDVSPMRRLGEPAEIADAVLWLCSDRASFITGQAIGVDGGYLATGA
jgi:NAD(P)-dependent dehydrogenase (short-subunit alcohol dehydrogenase family)